MEIEKQTAGSKIHVALSGEVTLAGAGRLQTALGDCLAAGRPVVLDLERVTEIDLAGLQVLVASERSFAAREQTFTILHGKCVAETWMQAGYPRQEVSCGEDNHDRG